MGKRMLIGMLLLCLCVSARCENAAYIRVVSRDDSPAAQQEKFRVRDAILPLLTEECDTIADLLAAIEAAADEIAPCSTQIRPWAPEGYPVHSTVYVTIGDGKGPNWWGILYDGGIGLFAVDDGGEKVTFDWPWIRWMLNAIGIK